MPDDVVTETPAADPGTELDINAALDQIEADPQPEDEAEAVEATEAKPAAKPGKAAAAPAAASDDLSDLLAEGVKWTPETVKTAATRVQTQAKAAQELVSKSHKLWGTAEKHARKVETREQRVQEVGRTLNSQVQLFNASLNAIKTGDAKTALEGLRTIIGSDPVQWLEDLNIHIASNGKKKPKSPEILEMEARLERFEQAERARAEQGEEAEAKRFVAQRKVELVEFAKSAPDDYPLLAEIAEENPRGVADSLASIITENAKRGRKVADSEAARMLEEQLQQQSELSERARQKREKRATDSGSGRGTGTPSQQANPGTAQTPHVKGKSLSVSAVQASSVKRELTDDELAEDAANFLPPALVNWARNAM
jgi:hypothetical protein